MNVTDAERDFASLVNKVHAEGISVDLERDERVIARLVPAIPTSPLTADKLADFFRNLPRLGDDSEKFSEDVRRIRSEFPAEKSAWD